MSAIGIGRIISRIVIVLLSGWLTKQLSKLLSENEAIRADRINRYSRSNLKLTMRERKQLRFDRISLPIIIYSAVIALFVVVGIVILAFSRGEWDDAVILSLVTIVGGLIINMSKSITINEGNISTLVAKELKNRYYTLYLRAFKSDRDASNFSEKDFVSLVAKMGDPDIYAVGLPNETDAPSDAKRVYVDDSTWKQEVKELMQNATKIYLRVGDTEPCRWEFRESQSHKDKLILIVDNISEYDAVRAEFPNLPQLQAVEDCFYILRYKEAEDNWETQKYKLSPKGYVNVTDNDAEYENVLEIVKQERKEEVEQKINPNTVVIGIIVFLLILAGSSWYQQRAERHYSTKYFYSNPSITLDKQVVDEEFEADNDIDAYKYAKTRFSSIVDSLSSQYNGNLEHDDSLDLLTPIGFRVFDWKDSIIRLSDWTRREILGEYRTRGEILEKYKFESIHGAEWLMSIEDIQQISFFSSWQREEISLSIKDTLETISLLRGSDTLANHIFDEYLFFLGTPTSQKMGGAILLSSQTDCNHLNIMQVYADVKYHFRKKYGAYNKCWDYEIKNVTCDTITYRDYSGVVVKIEYTYGSWEPRLNNMAQAIIEQL